MLLCIFHIHHVLLTVIYIFLIKMKSQTCPNKNWTATEVNTAGQYMTKSH